MMKKLGLIVNPVAGIGGRVGLKGSDGIEIQERAAELGALPMAGRRALEALLAMSKYVQDVEIHTSPGEMGAHMVHQAGFKAHIVGEPFPGKTTAADTIRAASMLLQRQVDLLVFAGGDGTARDIYNAVEDKIPVLGIPAGVKIHSPVFATHPRAAGELAAVCINEGRVRFEREEVIDLDEEAYRKGIISTRLYGYLKVPYHRRWLQGGKTPSPASEQAQMEAIAWDLVESWPPGYCFILGPGTTTRAIAERLGCEKTLVGVDVVSKEKVLIRDASERQLLNLLNTSPAKIVVTPVGGQGFLLGRGNQPISPQVIEMAGSENLVVVCTPGKLHSFAGRPLLVDSGDADLDHRLAGHIRLITGYRERAVYRIGG